MSCPTIWLPMALGGLAPSAEVLLLRSLWVAWRDGRHSARAELENMRVLDRLGATYVERRESERVQAPTVVHISGTIALLVFYDLSFGSATLSSQRHAATVAHVIGHGALYAVFMTLFSLTFLRNKVDGQERRPTAGTQL